MILLFFIGLFIVGCILEACGSDWEKSERSRAEQFELMLEETRRAQDARWEKLQLIFGTIADVTSVVAEVVSEQIKEHKAKKITRNFAKDEYGRVLAQEILEEA